MTDLAFCACDQSGDRYLATLLPYLPGSHYGLAGVATQKQGGDCLNGSENLAFNSFFISPQNLCTLFKYVQELKTLILKRRTKFLLLVDYGGLNLKLAKWGYEQGLTILYHIPPKVWAHGSKRIQKLKQFVHETNVVFPFEKTYFENRGLSTSFWGHPLLDPKKRWAPSQKLLIAPGSRIKEIKSHTPILLKSASLWLQKNPSWSLHWSCAHQEAQDLTQQFLSQLSSDEQRCLKPKLSYHFGLFPEQDVQMAWCCLGTAAFEVAYAQIPHVSFYQTDLFSATLVHLFVRTPFAHLANLCFQKKIIPEIFQSHFKPSRLIKESNELFEKKTQESKLKELTELFPPNPAFEISQSIQEMLKRGPRP